MNERTLCALLFAQNPSITCNLSLDNFVKRSILPLQGNSSARDTFMKRLLALAVLASIPVLASGQSGASEQTSTAPAQTVAQANSSPGSTAHARHHQHHKRSHRHHRRHAKTTGTPQ
jgi:hypothetical protein